jgi:hypothetical protein
VRWANSPPLVRLAAPVGDQCRFGLVPLGALDAVVLAQSGQILDELGVLVLFEVLGRQQIGLDLVDVPVFGLSVVGSLTGWGHSSLTVCIAVSLSAFACFGHPF